MSEVIQLNHQSENTYEFDLEVDGLATVQMLAWFVIVGKGMEFTFPCKQDGNHFSCKIPPMPFLEKTAYKGAVRLVADDYYFEVVSDLVVNVTGNLSFERGDVKNMTVKSTIKDTKKTDSKTDAKAKPDAKDKGKDAKGKVNETSVNTSVQRVETPSEIAKRLMNETPAASKREIPSFNVRNTDSRIERKGTPSSLKEALSTGKDALIESEVSQFVSDEQAAKERRLREILRNFTVDPDSSPSKARFTRKP